MAYFFIGNTPFVTGSEQQLQESGYYLFQGLSLTAIEQKLFKTDAYHGWLSKTFLNYYGIDTEKENKGIYTNKTVPEVVEELYKSSNIAHVRVAKLMKEKEDFP